MAKIFSTPKEIKTPKLDWNDVRAYDNACDKFKAELKTFLIKHVSEEKEVGEVIKFPVGDGHAEYMVASMKPLQLIHLEIGDGWCFQYANLLTTKEVRENIKQQKNIAKLFGG